MSNAFDTATDANTPPPDVLTGSTGKGDAPLAAVGKTGGTPTKSLDDLVGPQGDLTKLEEKKIGADAGMAFMEHRKQEVYAARQEHMIAAEGATMEDLKPWNADKELNNRKTDLWEQFGSPGFVIAMLASSFTAMPMNSALNAGAAAMNAINAGDMDKYNKAFDAWKENSSLTLKRLDLEEKQFDQIDHLRSRSMADWQAQASALAARFNDQRMLALLNAGYNDKVLEAKTQMKTSAVEMAKADEFLTKNNLELQITTALRGDSKDPMKIVEAKRIAETISEPGPKTGEQLAIINAISDPGFIDLSNAEKQKKLNEAIRGVSDARAGAHVTGMQREIDRRTSVWETEHPGAPNSERDAARDKITKDVATSYKATVSPAGSENVAGAIQQWTEARGSAPTSEMKAIIQSAYNTKGSTGGARIAQIGTALTEIKDRLAKGEQLDDAAQEKILRSAVQQAATGMTLSKEDADFVADQYLAGDRMAAAGFARSAQNMAMIRRSIREKAQEQGMSGADLAMRIAEFHGIVSAETAAGRREVTIGMFANEARTVIDIAKRASKEVPRGEFIPFNRAMLAFEKNTGDVKVVALGSALNAVINTYAKAINGGQQGTVSDKDHAREVIELAYSDNQMDAVYGIMEKELQAALDAPGQVKQSLRDLHSGKVKPAPGDPGVIRYDSSGNRVQ